MAAPVFRPGAHRPDPYVSFTFQVVIEGTVVAGLHKMTAPGRALRKARAAAGRRHEGSPGAIEHEPLRLEQGVTRDPVFHQWASLVNRLEGDAAVSLRNFRKELTIRAIDLNGKVAISYKVKRAWVSEYQALPEMDAGSNTVAIEAITIEHEGFYRDEPPAEPQEA
jgi:phage tail-like protein